VGVDEPEPAIDDCGADLAEFGLVMVEPIEHVAVEQQDDWSAVHGIASTTARIRSR
jgi:hypothetical protein